MNTHRAFRQRRFAKGARKLRRNSGLPCLDQGFGASMEDAAVQEVGLAQGWGPPTLPEQDPGALSRVCGLLQQLHRAYSGLASSLQGLPAELQQPVGRARHSLCELYSVVASAGSLKELHVERLGQSLEDVQKAWQGLEQLLEGVQHNPPLSWLVGPFALPPGRQQL
ncbi:Perilipin-4 [Saguinus oedipus]|uniref:Perilipin-4 n=1 Tax=Saguinus oedipus TaxID=9490 RepID=A0ABQ9TRR1_SAGOE|nr:Perilipin-4 [Saguinus oedipus]